MVQLDYYINVLDNSVVVDFVIQQFGGGVDEIIYNMDVDSLVVLLEYGVGEIFLNFLVNGLNYNGMG